MSLTVERVPKESEEGTLKSNLVVAEVPSLSFTSTVSALLAVPVRFASILRLSSEEKIVFVLGLYCSLLSTLTALEESVPFTKVI